MASLRLSLVAIGAASLTTTAFGITGPAEGGADLAKLLGERVAGTPVNCIRLRDVESTQIIPGAGLLFQAIGGRIYLNRPRTGADLLRNDELLITPVETPSLCSLDTVRLRDRSSAFDRGSVSLGKFVPYDRPEPRH